MSVSPATSGTQRFLAHGFPGSLFPPRRGAITQRSQKESLSDALVKARDELAINSEPMDPRIHKRKSTIGDVYSPA